MPFLFGDDVMFRGNSATLEDVNIYIDKESVMMLNSSRAFCRKYMNLRRVVVNDGFDNESLSFVPDDIMSKFLCKLAYSAQRLTLSTTLATERLLSMTPRRLHFEHVQELDLYAKPLSLYAILNLLRAAPTLVKLTCDVSGLGSGFGHIVPGDIPDYIVSTYGAAGKNLKLWIMPSVTNGERSLHITEYYMLVALACPRLSPFGHTSINLLNYHTTIVESLQSGPYSKYAQRLVRLIHGV
ncbi:hypothetical protein LPJ71_001612 [Coemansia sp. S17]|nr:hypothetical protein LPJ71_001612 [Coemansia sp. S17]